MAEKTDSHLSLNNAQPADGGSYSVIVSNPFGRTASQNGKLAVYVAFPQGGADDIPPNPDIPKQFGPCRESTVGYGCTLCSLASLLTSYGAQTTPVLLDAALISHNGYSEDHVHVKTLCDRILFNPNVQNAINEFAPIGFWPIQLGNQSLNSYLDAHSILNDERVILGLNMFIDGVRHDGHYIMVAGKNGSDWDVFDPGWRSATPLANLSSLQGHFDGFYRSKTVNGTNVTSKYSFTLAGGYVFRPKRPGMFMAQARCPVDLLVVDPTGRRVGLDSVAATNLTEISDATYVREDPQGNDDDETAPSLGDSTGIKSIYIPSPLPRNYKIYTTGTATGAYTLDIATSCPVDPVQFTTYSGVANQ